MKITPNQFTILECLIAGPQWMRSFQTVRPLLKDLQAKGLIESCRPHLGRACNMVRLTAAGCELLEISPDSVPVERAQPKLEQKPKLVPGQIRAGLPLLVRQRCEAFVRALANGETPSVIVGQLAEAHGVQRPAIWRNLRSGGVIAPYKHRARRGPVEIAQATKEASVPDPVGRDPCPRCGVRGDIGCHHRKARLAAAVFG